MKKYLWIYSIGVGYAVSSNPDFRPEGAVGQPVVLQVEDKVNGIVSSITKVVGDEEFDLASTRVGTHVVRVGDPLTQPFWAELVREGHLTLWGKVA